MAQAALPIPITEEPSFDPPREFPANLKGARCLIACEGDPEPSFMDAFLRELHGAGFVDAEQDFDFLISLRYEAREEACALPGYPAVDRRVVAKSSARFEASQARGSRAFACAFAHAQPTSPTRAAAMRSDHAKVVGRLLAKKAIAGLAQARGAVSFRYELFFKGYEAFLQRDLGELLGRVVDPSSISQSSSGAAGVFHYLVETELPVAKLREALEDALLEEGLEAEVRSPDPSVLIFQRR